LSNKKKIYFIWIYNLKHYASDQTGLPSMTSFCTNTVGTTTGAYQQPDVSSSSPLSLTTASLATTTSTPALVAAADDTETTTTTTTSAHVATTSLANPIPMPATATTSTTQHKYQNNVVVTNAPSASNENNLVTLQAKLPLATVRRLTNNALPKVDQEQ
jgi:hypothetical protein